MQLFALARSRPGFRGCLIDRGRYRFFHLSADGRLRWMKDYAVEAFEDHAHFLAVMLKYLLPASIFLPPVEIGEITPGTLERLLLSRNQKTGNAR